MQIQRKLSNGTWTDEDRIEMFVDKILEREIWYAERKNREPMTSRQQVLDLLATGETINYDSEFYAEIRDADATKARPTQKVRLVKCGGCKRDFPRNQIMSAAMGRSCPDCYDRMSN